VNEAGAFMFLKRTLIIEREALDTITRGNLTFQVESLPEFL
jgi:hypothetical protein